MTCVLKDLYRCCATDYRQAVMRILLFLLVSVPLTSAVTHTLQCFLTGVTPGISFPEFTAISQVDEEQIAYYDSNSTGVIVKADWINKSNDEEHWKMIMQFAVDRQEKVRVRLDNLMKLFNQTEDAGLRTVQEIYGCELNDNGTKKGYRLFGYNGEDFISLDVKNTTWTAAVPQAETFKQEWEKAGVRNQKYFLETECIEWLQKYVGYGRSALERKVSPEVSLFQKNSSSPVVCHATGFFPKAVMISWQNNGEELHEDMDLGETLPNHNGTFQRRSILTVSPGELDRNQYTCVVHHEGLEKKLQVSDRRVLSAGGGSVGIIIGAVVAVLLLVIVGCVGVFIWKKKSGFTAVPASSTSDSVRYSSSSPNPNPSSLS